MIKSWLFWIFNGLNLRIHQGEYEATSALDNVTQQRVADYLASMKCARITIAHRLETIRQCDRIIVLGNGRVVREGTFDELLAVGVLQKG